jgi:hypothetical protein
MHLILHKRFSRVVPIGLRFVRFSALLQLQRCNQALHTLFATRNAGHNRDDQAHLAGVLSFRFKEKCTEPITGCFVKLPPKSGCPNLVTENIDVCTSPPVYEPRVSFNRRWVAQHLLTHQTCAVDQKCRDQNNTLSFA